MRKHGFTLIELLVVIAIIAVLAAILFPTFATVKERGRQTRCCNNLRQLTWAFFTYADDNNGLLPIGSRRIFYWNGVANPKEWTGTKWLESADPPVPIDVRAGSLWKYVRNVEVYQCPTDRNMPAWNGKNKIYGKPSITPGFGLSYSQNWQLGVKFSGPGSKKPATTVKLQTAVAGRSSRIMFLIHESRKTINDGYFSWPGDVYDKIHYDGTDCSYADGHVKWLSNEEMARIETLGNAGPWARNSYYYYAVSGGKSPDPTCND